MVETLENSLPAKILNKPKTGFSVPVEQWFGETTAGSDKVEGVRLRKWAKYVYNAQTGA